MILALPFRPGLHGPMCARPRTWRNGYYQWEQLTGTRGGPDIARWLLPFVVHFPDHQMLKGIP